MADMCHNLQLGHFVGRFHRDGLRAGFILLESLFQFALGLAGTKDQDRSGITKTGNDLVVVARKMPGVLSAANRRQALSGIQIAQWKAPRNAGVAFPRLIGSALFLPRFLTGRQ